jgi:hypothetical protein
MDSFCLLSFRDEPAKCCLGKGRVTRSQTKKNETEKFGSVLDFAGHMSEKTDQTKKNSSEKKKLSNYRRTFLQICDTNL